MGKKTTTETPPVTTDPDAPLAEGTVLTEGLMPIIEAAQVIVPKKGSLFEDRVIEGGHTVKVGRFAIIRPCQSKGRAIRGHRPIYEARMLAENAAVFGNWPMYLDHASEELVEGLAQWLQERGRSIKDLGGRVLKSFWDPEVAFESDEENGYRKGAIVGEVIPQPLVRGMLEADPLSLAVSINAWPKSVRIGKASWSPAVTGAVIEGIRSTPMGSVDFVPRGGAGGRVLTEGATEEEVASAVSLLESAYAAARADDPDDPKERPVKKKLSEMTDEEIGKLSATELQEALREHNPSLAESLFAEPDPSAGNDDGAHGGMVTEAVLDQRLREQREALVEEFGGSAEAAEEMAEEIVKEREGLRRLENHAAKKLAEAKRNGLPAEYVEEIAKGYEVTIDGGRPNLIVREEDCLNEEGEAITPEEVIERRLRSDIETAIKLIEAVGGKAPRIEGLAPTGKTDPADRKTGPEQRKRLREGSALFDFLKESGDLTGDPEKDDQHIREMVEG